MAFGNIGLEVEMSIIVVLGSALDDQFAQSNGSLSYGLSEKILAG